MSEHNYGSIKKEEVGGGEIGWILVGQILVPIVAL